MRYYFMQAHDPSYHIQLLNNTHNTQYLHGVRKMLGNIYTYNIKIKSDKWTVWLCSHYRHEHVFTRLICLFVEQMVSICLRGRLLLLLSWQRNLCLRVFVF